MALVRDENGKLQYVRADGTVAASSRGSWHNKKVTTDQGAKDYNNFLYELDTFQRQMDADFKSRDGKYQSADTLGRTKTRTDERIAGMRKKVGQFASYFNTNSGLYDDESVSMVRAQLADAAKFLDSVRDAAKSEQDYWSQWETEDDYNTYSRRASMDIGNSQKTIEAKRAELKKAEEELAAAQRSSMSMPSLTGGTSDGNGPVAWDRAQEAQKKIEALRREIGLAEVDISEAERIQRSQMYAKRLELPDIDVWATRGAAINNPTFEEVEGTWEVTGKDKREGKIGNIVTYSRDNWERLAAEDAETGTYAGSVLYHYMTEDEVKLYNATLAKEGKAAAKEFLDYLMPTLQARYGAEQGKNISGIQNPIAKTAALGFFSLGAGTDQWVSGTKQLFTGETLPTSPTQVASQTIQGSLGKTGKLLYGAGTTIGNMLPSIILGNAVGGIAGATAGKVASAVSMGGASAGNTYNQVMQAAADEGYTRDQAMTYAGLVGASEAMLSYLIGGAGNVAGVGEEKLLAKVAGIDNVFARLALSGAIRIGSEEAEELAQLWIEPVLKTLILGTEFEAPTWEEHVETAIITALSTGILEGGSLIGTEIDYGQYGKYLLNNSNKYQQSGVYGVIGEALANLDPKSKAYRMAQAMQEQLSSGVNPTYSDVGRLHAMLLYERSNNGGKGWIAGINAKERISDAPAVTKEPASPGSEVHNAAQEVVAAETERQEAMQQTAQEAWNQAATRAFGETGAKAFQTVNDGSIDSEALYAGFAVYHHAGMTGRDMNTITSQYAKNLPEDFRKIAYDAGVQDAAASVNARENAAQITYGTDAGVIANDYSKGMNKKLIRAVDEVAKSVGRKVIFEDLGSEDNGYLDDNGVIHIDIHAEDPELVVFAHEITHVMEDLAPVEHKRYRDYVLNKLADAYGGSVLELVEEHKRKNAAQNLSDERTMNELVADYTKRMMKDRNLFAEFAKKDRTAAQRLVDAVKRFLQKVKNFFNGNRQAQNEAAQREFGMSIDMVEEAAKLWEEALTASQAYAQKASQNQAANKNTVQQDGGNVRRSKKTEEVQNSITAEYQKTVDGILNGTNQTRSAVLMGYTPEIYQELGMPSLPFVVGAGHIYSVAKTEAEAKKEGIRYSPGVHYHGLGDAAVKNLYEAVRDPILIIASKDADPAASPLRSTHSVVAIADVRSGNKSLLFPIELTAERTVDGTKMDVNVLSSAYYKSVANLVAEAVAQENIGNVGVYYITKKATSLPVDGVQFPNHLAAAVASDGIVRRFPEKVNMSIEKNTQSIQFKRWFGDWQNNPKKASAVVDDQNEPLVVYHGTSANIDEFKPEFTGKGNDQYGSGYYFTTSEETAGQYAGGEGGNVIPAYLNIRRPLVLDTQGTPHLYEVDVTARQAASIIAKHPNIMDEEESILGDYFDEYWETGPTEDLVRRLGREYDWTLGSLETDIFRGYPEAYHTAVKAVLGYDGVQVNFPDGSKHYVAWFPNQVKHATENTGEFSDKDNRIRRSRKGGSVVDTAAARAEDVDALKRQVEYWKSQVKQTKGFKVNTKDVEKLAKQLMRTYKVDTDTNVLTKKLQDLYDGIATGYYGNKEIDYETAQARSEEIAKIIVEDAVETENEMYVEYAELRKYLRSTTLNISAEDSHDIPDFNDFRKRNMGRMRIGTKGTNIDTVYKEMATLWPEFFNEETETTPSDQLLRISEVMEGVYRTQEVNPFGRYAEETVSDIADEVLAYFFTLPQAQTFADKAAARLKQSTADARLAGQMSQGRQDAKQLRQANDQIDRLKVQLKQAKADAQLAGQMAQGRKDAPELRKANKKVAALEAKLSAANDNLLAEQMANGRIHANMIRMASRAQERAKAALEQEKKRGADAIKMMKDVQAAKTSITREQRKAAELRGKIIRHSRDMSQKLLRPTDKKHVPEQLRVAVATLLEAINLESHYAKSWEFGPDGEYHRVESGSSPYVEETKRTYAFLKLKEAYSEIRKTGELVEDPNLFGDGDVKGWFDQAISYGDTRIADMTAAQLEIIWKTLRALEHTITNYGKTLASKKHATTVEWAGNLKNDTASRKPKKHFGKERVSLDMETPLTFFSHFGDAGRDIYRMLRNAQDSEETMTRQIVEAAQKIAYGRTVEDLEKDYHEFETERGEKLTLTTAQVMDIYNLSRRKQAQAHLMEGGIIQPAVKSAKIKQGENPILLSIKDQQTIVGELTKEQKEMADELQKLTNTLAEFGNKASMAVYGYKKFTDSDYWPIHSAAAGVHWAAEKSSDNAASIKNIGLAKPVVPGANNALDIESVFDVFARHSSEMIGYSAWLAAMEDANRLFNFRFRNDAGAMTDSVKAILNTYAGKGADQYWKNLMTNIQNGIRSRETSIAWKHVAKVIGATKGAAVAWNPRVVVQQPTAFLRAAVVLDPKYMAQCAWGVTKGNAWKKAQKYAPIAARKADGTFDMGSAASMKETMFGSQSNLRKLNEVGMAGAAAADAVTWGGIWNACEHQVADTQKSLEVGTEAFYKAVAEVFTDVIDQSQVVDGVLQRAQIMRSSNASVKEATSFMGESIMGYNILVRAKQALTEERNPEKRKAAAKMFGRAAIAMLATDLVNALAQSLPDAWRDDDEDKTYWEKFWSAFTGVTGDEENFTDYAMNIGLKGNAGSNINPLGRIPFLSDVLSLIQGYEVNRPEAQVVEDVLGAASGAINSTSKENRKMRIWYTGTELAHQVAKLFGVGVGNLKRDILGIVRTAVADSGNIPLQYELEKAIYHLASSKNNDRYMDIMFRALKLEDLDSFRKISAELMETGVTDGVKIDSAMKSRIKKEQKDNPNFNLSQAANDLIASLALYDVEEEPEKFGADDLDATAYRSYAEQRGGDYREWADTLSNKPFFSGLDNEVKNDLLKAAYKVAHQKALEDYSDGQFEIDTKWVNWALDGEDHGVDVTEAILFKTAYGAATSDYDENGKAIPGSKKQNTLDLAAEWLPGLTEEELEYLMSNYWSDKKN